MGFKYHPPTRTACPVCEKFMKNDVSPLIDTYSGRASSANGYPFHEWYNFVLGYTPLFPEYMLQREEIKHGDGKVVLDPFVGSGTTQLVCKLNGIPSYGIDANDFMVFAASQKLNWQLDAVTVRKCFNKVQTIFNKEVNLIDWIDLDFIKEFVNLNRPKSLDERYISDKPLAKIMLLKKAVNESDMPDAYYDLFMFAISSILVPVSNVKYGPGFGIGKIKDDVDVWGVFCKKIDQIIHDLESVTESQKETVSVTYLGDSRNLSEQVEKNSISLMITSPPYPGDHEYTKHSKLELIFNGYATDLASFRTIKKRMIRGSTTNIYKNDNEREAISDIEEIQDVIALIDERLKNDGATSGFEKLYTKLVLEYFGGMYHTLKECYAVLKPEGKIALLVSDSHAFKMVHIKTAELLQKVGEKAGFVNSEIILWQNKLSTSHKYLLRENILILQKPK